MNVTIYVKNGYNKHNTDMNNFPTNDQTVILTCDRGEVDANQQGEEAGDISQDVSVSVGVWGLGVEYCW